MSHSEQNRNEKARLQNCIRRSRAVLGCQSVRGLSRKRHSSHVYNTHFGVFSANNFTENIGN